MTLFCNLAYLSNDPRNNQSSPKKQIMDEIMHIMRLQ